jgi:hypothetical protein
LFAPADAEQLGEGGGSAVTMTLFAIGPRASERACPGKVWEPTNPRAKLKLLKAD